MPNRFKEGQAVCTIRVFGSERGTINQYIDEEGRDAGIAEVLFEDGQTERYADTHLVAWSDVFTAQTLVNLPMKVHPDVLRLAEAFLDIVGQPAFAVETV